MPSLIMRRRNRRFIQSRVERLRARRPESRIAAVRDRWQAPAFVTIPDNALSISGMTLSETEIESQHIEMPFAVAHGLASP